jgi:hypothetical protein
VGFTLHRRTADGRHTDSREPSQRAATTGAWRNGQALGTCFSQTAFFHAALPASSILVRDERYRGCNAAAQSACKEL